MNTFQMGHDLFFHSVEVGSVIIPTDSYSLEEGSTTNRDDVVSGGDGSCPAMTRSPAKKAMEKPQESGETMGKPCENHRKIWKLIEKQWKNNRKMGNHRKTIRKWRFTPMVN